MQHMRSGITVGSIFPALLLAFAACGGPASTKDSVGQGTVSGGSPRLESVKFGRVVDIYAYHRIDPKNGDRRDQFNRLSRLVDQDILVNSSIESQAIYDAGGEEVVSANYQYLPFDSLTGRESLLILWDNEGPEAGSFDAALTNAQLGLTELAASYRGQNTSTRPIPVIPRNAAFQLSFSAPINLTQGFFEVNPSAVQLLEIKGDPLVVSAVDAFRAVPFRIILRGNSIILDTSLLGNEGGGGQTSSGMPQSVDSVTANIRIAIPSRGSVSPAFYVRDDAIPELNSVDSFGRNSVCRDFRSGNRQDGTAGTIRDLESPMIVSNAELGIISVDAVNGLITLNKRLHNLPVRGRMPFVDGAVSPETGYPKGPASVPTVVPLRSGDFLIQNVPVALPGGGSEIVRVRAEILQNLGVGTISNDPNFPGLGLASDGSQGESASVYPTATVRVASVEPAFDSLGRPVRFLASPLPAGADCILRVNYYERVRFLVGDVYVSDAGSRAEFLKVDPNPAAAAAGSANVMNVSPQASVSIEFSEPIDFDGVDNSTNFVLANATMPQLTAAGVDFATQLQNPKLATAGIVPTQLTDQSGDATVLSLKSSVGLFHMNGQQETYWLHLLIGSSSVTDLNGNPLAIYQFGGSGQAVSNWSVSFALSPTGLQNLVGWHIYRFESIDEDGTLPGSTDIFGQYRMIGGRLVAAETLRFNRNADSHNLGAISRIARGECWDSFNDALVAFPGSQPYVTGGGPVNGNLYLQPRMVDTVLPPNVPAVFLPPNTPQPVGHVIEPHQPRGSRMMMRYIEDDFELSSSQAADFMLDVEQLYWSPFNDDNVLFDVFDRYTMSLSHGDLRQDEAFVVNPGNPTANPPVAPFCQLACPSFSSSLSSTFLENPLQGTAELPVFQDKVYTINPNNAFRSAFNIKYVAYPRFDRSYTWRDSRLVTTQSGSVVGLSGAHEPQAPAPNNDWTANVDSPWIRSKPDLEFTSQGGTTWVMDDGDFRGSWKRDHDPIAAPLVVDFKVFPDGAANGIARGTNGFQVAMLGGPSNFAAGAPGGYYNATGAGCANRDPWPRVRVHRTGGLDPNTNQDILVDPGTALTAFPSWVKDAGAIVLIGAGFAGNPAQGLIQAPAGDGMLNWAQADFVRKVSSMTLGFFDTLNPNRRQLTVATSEAGIPDFAGLTAQIGNVRVQDLVTQFDPPQNRQPAGTSILLEIRGAESFGNSAILYDPNTNDSLGTAFGGTGVGRGNLLNPNYACEAYRYSKPNGGPAFDTPRVRATELSAYVTQDNIGLLRLPATQLLPRFLNLRVTMSNNVQVSPAVSPSIRSLSVAYRMQQTN